MSKPRHYGTTGLFAQPIGKGLQKLHKNTFDKTQLELVRLGTHWSEITGDFAAKSSRPTKLIYTRSSATLHISTTSAIALEIQHMQPIILQRVAEILGHKKIQRIQLMQDG
ncbi:MAG: DUF721 domain-containing protein [Rickettsiales bacterium]|nr:DUF721 domain-containing protein [Rickettsiales bacterium]